MSWRLLVGLDDLPSDPGRARPSSRSKGCGPPTRASTTRCCWPCEAGSRPARIRVYRLVCDHDAEGVVAKWEAGRYLPNGTTTSWLKIKNPDYSQGIDRHELFAGRHAGRRSGRRAYVFDPAAPVRPAEVRSAGTAVSPDSGWGALEGDGPRSGDSRPDRGGWCPRRLPGQPWGPVLAVPVNARMVAESPIRAS